jgi:hypothetical protein
MPVDMRQAKTLQTRFLVERGFMTWQAARDLPQAERDALQAEYAKWIKQPSQKHPCPRCRMTVPDEKGLVPCWHRDCPE